MDNTEKLLFGFIGGVLAFIIILLIPLLSKFFGAKVKLPPLEELMVQVALGFVLGAAFGVVGAFGALAGGAENEGKAIFMGGGAQALLKEGFASVKASAQQPDIEGAAEKPAHRVLKAVASSGQSLLYRDWR